VSDVVSKIIAQAASSALLPLGLRRRGRSRIWIDDHGWWLINVDFQPSGFEKGCYLNVGHQHLWVRRNHLVFGDFERPLGGSSFVKFGGDEREFALVVEKVAMVAANAVERRRAAHGEGDEALRRAMEGSDDLDGGIAAALRGDSALARQRLQGSVHPAYREQASEFMRVSNDLADSVARDAVTATRRLLRLAEKWQDWRT
jgi:hypothetical protein